MSTIQVWWGNEKSRYPHHTNIGQWGNSLDMVKVENPNPIVKPNRWLYLNIQTDRVDRIYSIRLIAPSENTNQSEIKCYRLLKKAEGDHKAETYYCRQYYLGNVACTCNDFIHRKRAFGGFCKHLSALVDSGLLTPYSVEIGMELEFLRTRVVELQAQLSAWPAIGEVVEFQGHPVIVESVGKIKAVVLIKGKRVEVSLVMLRPNRSAEMGGL